VSSLAHTILVELSMIFHTGSYVRSHYNFVISGLDEAPHFTPVTSSLFNVLFRGSPTRPSSFLKEELHKIGIQYNESAAIFVDDDCLPNWDNTVLGQDSSINPALNFFEHTLPSILGEYKFVCSLIRPECLITEIVEAEESEKFQHQRVDFFIPAANIVIEIDGSQHQQQVANSKDIGRDRFLRHHGIKVIRINTWQLDVDKEMNKVKAILLKTLGRNPLLNFYKDNLGFDNIDSLSYITVFRLQIVIIEMMVRGVLQLNDDIWRLKIESDVEDTVLQIAIKDLFNWFSVINRQKVFPRVDINSGHQDYDITISVVQRWDDSTNQENRIICQTDHFEYFPPEKKPNYATGKDYFYAKYSQIDEQLDPIAIDLNKLLFETFSYESFNPGQIDIIENVIRKSDTIGILPTGGGKSICYQLPGIIFSGLTIVVCPIKSLMRDQVQELVEIGFHRSACIDSDTSAIKKKEILRRVKNGKIRFLFVSPERLQIPEFRESIQLLHNQSVLSLVVIDEVHCMSEWGHDFRTSYLTLPNTLATVTPDIPRLCLTATASKKVLEDIKNEFKIDSEDVKTLSKYERSNLHFHVIDCDPINRMHQILHERVADGKISHDRACIAFTSVVNGPKGAFSLYNKAKSYCDDVGLFTGAKPKDHNSLQYDKEKLETQTNFKANKIPLLVATKAFGMGVNKKNVYTTIHAGLPSSIEALYQEAGRAGRDKSNSDCFLLYNSPNKDLYNRFFDYGDFSSFFDLKDALRYHGGDLSTHHFFLCGSIKQNLNVPKIVSKILKHLDPGNSNDSKSEIVSDRFNSTPDNVELALYRLYQMGVVTDWTVADFSRGIYLIDYTLNDLNYHIDFVLKYLDNIGSKITEISASDSWHSGMVRLAEIVVQNHLNTRIHSRIESIKTLMIACESYNIEDPAAFRNHIESFFAIDDINDSLSDIVESSGDQATIINYLSGLNSTPILHQSIDKIDKRLFPLRRYIESYPSDIGLALLNALMLAHKGDNQGLMNAAKIFAMYRLHKGYSFNKHLDFIKQLSTLCKKEVWKKMEPFIGNNLSDDQEIDQFAKQFDSDEITSSLLGKYNKKISRGYRDYNELV